jgi:ribosomal silencing factor RsfS
MVRLGVHSSSKAANLCQLNISDLSLAFDLYVILPKEAHAEVVQVVQAQKHSWTIPNKAQAAGPRRSVLLCFVQSSWLN